MAYYEIRSVRLRDLGAVGDIIELTDEEFVRTPYASYLYRLERKPSNVKKKVSKKKSSEQGEE